MSAFKAFDKVASGSVIGKAGKKLFGGPKDTGASGAEETLLGMAHQQWADYQSRYVPLENKFIGVVRKTPGQFERARGMVASDVAQSSDFQANQALRSRLLAGAPNSGGNVMSMTDSAVARGKTMSAGVTEATTAMQGQQDAGLMKAVNLGRNIQDSSNLGMRNAAGMATQSALDQAKANQMERAGLYNAVGTAAGMYGGYRFGAGTPGSPPGAATPMTYQPAPSLGSGTYYGR